MLDLRPTRALLLAGLGVMIPGRPGGQYPPAHQSISLLLMLADVSAAVNSAMQPSWRAAAQVRSHRCKEEVVPNTMADGMW